ncbi:LuxR C-terminal-related transcriptional regulator [Novosphingobium aquimarinum]|uniref:LuxR C-terminal-related transcriptional regulator n=1 Tax=Novosphingobium aquimarinum TaxID=2682494 RepID=UPI0012EC25F8|nr:LuxR C-terminal-related transcriptional regulator [Novosphingobium aquimarinum]
MSSPPLFAARDRSTARRLVPPRQQVVLCERALVLRSLEVARRGRLTIVMGPPGYGKTTALGQWHARLKQAGHAVAWYSAAEAEREPTQFLRLLVLAMEVGGIDPGAAARRAAVGSSLEAILDGIILGLEQAKEPIVLIVDDYDRIDQDAVGRCVTELLDALPSQVNLVLGTRRKPGLALATLRASGGVRTIDPDELRLSTKELAVTLGLPEDAPDVATVLAQTEGWPVAVQLYRLWRERVATGAMLPAFGGNAGEVADYFAEQVVAALPTEQREALIALSIIEQVEASLADAIREADDSAVLLDALTQNLPSLVQQTDSNGEIAYRVHPLLSDFARGRLALEPGHAAELHRRAACWLSSHARPVEAVRHAVRGNSEDFLFEMLGELPFRSIFIDFGVGELRAILREIPPGALAAVPEMRLMQALVLFKSGLFREAEQLRAEVEQTIGGEGSGNRVALIESRALQLLFSVYMDGTASSLEEQVAWLLTHAPADPLTWAWCENTRMVIEQEQGKLEVAAASLARTREAFQAKQDSNFGLLQLVVHDLLLDFARGSLGAVHDRAGDLLRRDPTSQIGERCLHAMARMMAAAVDYQRTYRAQAADEMRIALAEYGSGEAWFDQYAIAMPAIVAVTFRRHGLSEAQREIDLAARDYELRGMACLEGIIVGVSLTYHVRAGASEAIADLEAECRRRLAQAAIGPSPWRERDLLRRALGELTLARGETSEPLALADALAAEGRHEGRRSAEIDGLILRARAHRAAGDRDAAIAALQDAVLCAGTEDVVAPFVEGGEDVEAILRELLAGPAPRIVQRHAVVILRIMETEKQVDDPDALSDREAEIVAHLADGASNKLIARRLGLTENTIKFHLKKVYAKLGVQSRQQAVARVLQR